MPSSCSPLRRKLTELSPNPAVAWAVFVALCGLLGLLQLLRNAYQIDLRELWLDEASTYMVAQYPLSRVLTLSSEFHSQPPFYYVLLHLLSLVNSSELCLRGMSWLFCLLLLFFVMVELNELRIFSRAGFCLLFISNDFALFLSRELRPYALSALSSFVASALFLRFVRRAHDARLAAAYLISALVMVYTLAFDVWPLVAQGLFGAGAILVAARRRGLREAMRELWPVAAALGALGALYLPYVLHVHAHAPVSPGKPPGLAAMLSAALERGHFSDMLSRFAVLPAPYSSFLVALAAYGIVGQIRRRDASFILWLLILFGQCAFTYGFLLGKLPVSFRYLTPAFPAFLMCVALGLDNLLALRLPWLSPVLLGMLALMVGEKIAPFQAFVRAPPPKENWRKLYSALQKIPGEKAFFFDTGMYAQMFEYVARADRSFSFFLDGYERIPGTEMSAGGAPMRRAYVEQAVAERGARTQCFFYSRDRRGNKDRETGVYEAAFVPAMERLGYTQTFSMQSPERLPDPYHDYYNVTGFCRP